MKAFLKEYGWWIAIPFVLAVGAVPAVYFLLGEEGPSPFQYNVF